MNKKSSKIDGLIAGCHGGDLDAHYLAYFVCFNQARFFEAHEVLERLWLADRNGPNHSFYKGMIQLACAFVHLQKDRLRPSAAVFKLARANLHKYPSSHEHLDVAGVLRMIDSWLKRLEACQFSVNPLAAENAPKLCLFPGASRKEPLSSPRGSR
jgi:predicted metal-dependent hydrolase